MIPANINAWISGRDYTAPATKEARFREQLKSGRQYELFVGAFLVNAGLTVSMAAATDAETRKARASVPDILVNNRFRVECKSTKLAIPSKGMVELDSVSSWKRKAEKPHYYVIVSKRTWQMVWTAGSDNTAWEVRQRYNKPYYFCPRELFRPIGALVTELKVQ